MAETLTDPLDEMILRLERARAMWAASKEEDRVKGQVHALSAVIGFLDAVCAPPHVKDPLSDLMAALIDRPGPTKSPLVESMMAMAAATASILHECGAPLEDALSTTASACGSRGPGKAKIKHFRENLLRKSRRESLHDARAIYHTLVQNSRQAAKEQRSAIALEQLRGMKDFWPVAKNP